MLWHLPPNMPRHNWHLEHPSLTASLNMPLFHGPGVNFFAPGPNFVCICDCSLGKIPVGSCATALILCDSDAQLYASWHFFINYISKCLFKGPILAAQYTGRSQGLPSYCVGHEHVLYCSAESPHWCKGSCAPAVTQCRPSHQCGEGEGEGGGEFGQIGMRIEPGYSGSWWQQYPPD